MKGTIKFLLLLLVGMMLAGPVWGCPYGEKKNMTSTEGEGPLTLPPGTAKK